MKCPFVTLGIEHAATKEAARRAYVNALKLAHPDVNGGSHDKAVELGEAHQRVRDGEGHRFCDCDSGPEPQVFTWDWWGDVAEILRNTAKANKERAARRHAAAQAAARAQTQTPKPPPVYRRPGQPIYDTHDFSDDVKKLFR